MEIITKNALETQKLGEKLAKDLIKSNQPVVICLYGDLGSGKTTFIQGFAKGLGITKRILSPTFIVSREYEFGKNKKFYHLDLYRFNNEKEAEILGLKELWENKNNILTIEWPEKIENILPKDRVEVRFEYIGEEKRKIKVMTND